MHSQKEIEKEAFKKLNQLPGSELKDWTEVEVEVYLPTENKEGRYTVFFERAHTGDKDNWTVRNIVRPDQLQKPQSKEDGKVE